MSAQGGRLEGAPVPLADGLAAVPVLGWLRAEDGAWTLAALAVLVASRAGVRAVHVPDALPAARASALPPPDEGPGAALTEAERDRLVASVFVGLGAGGPWRLLRRQGQAEMPAGTLHVQELGRFEWSGGQPRILPARQPL